PRVPPVSSIDACVAPRTTVSHGRLGKLRGTVAGQDAHDDLGPEGDRRSDKSLSRYLEARRTDSLGAGRSTIPFSDALRPLLSPAVRLAAKQVATNLVAPRARRGAAARQGGARLRLHLGSGGNNLPDWVNIDLVGAHADVAWDLRRPLPFADGTAEAVFLEHVLEHMTVEEGMVVLRNCRRVLRVGGIVRVGVPDAGLYATDYAEGHGTLERLRPGRPTRMLALGEVFQEHGHLSAWDGETLCLVLTESGFEGATVRPGGSSRIEPAPDSPARIPETVYAEAVRPA
ncbi:MAG TPA: methyltransferase domain-containing protein, partial [Acidimicrobiales bacterium]|nr:methyltransferase domain-containing protein [Acidimicrobiales bacterium]